VTDPIDPEVFYPPASMFLTRIPGRSGWWVGTAQALLGMPSRWTHGGVIGQGGGTFEAAPGGVYEGHVDDLHGRPHIVCDAPVQLAVKAAALGGAETRGEYERHLREAVLYSARELLGTPYSFLDYLALALYHLAPKARITALIRKRVEDSKHLICSAFVDRVMDRAGIHLYDDGRLSGDVTPSDLNAWFDDHNHIIDRVKA
jgi:hypothetical protein